MHVGLQDLNAALHTCSTTTLHAAVITMHHTNRETWRPACSAHIVRLQLAIDDRSHGVDDREVVDILIGLQLQREQRQQAVALSCRLLLRASVTNLRYAYATYFSGSRWPRHGCRCGTSAAGSRVPLQVGALSMFRIDVQDNAGDHTEPDGLRTFVSVTVQEDGCVTS
jgi:hypothetical protein